MSVIASELSNNLEPFLSKVSKENSVEQIAISSNLSNSLGGFFIFEREPVGAISSSPRYTSNTNAVSIPYSSKYRRSSRIRLGSTNSPSPATANGSISSQSLKESLNKTISSIIENCQEKVILHNNSPSSSFSFTKHSTIIYSPSKTSSSPLSSTSNKSKLSQDNVLTINKIKPNSLSKESKASEITFGLKKKEILSKLRKSSSDDTNLRKVNIRITKEQLLKDKEMKNEPNDIKIEVKEQTKKEEIQKDDIKIDDHLKEDVKKEDIINDVHLKDDIKKGNSSKEDIKKEIVEEIIKKESKTNKEEEKEKDSLESENIKKPIELVEVEENISKLVKVEVEKSVELKKPEEPVKPEVFKVEKKVEKKIEKKVKSSEESKIKSLAKLEAKKNKELLQKKKSSHKKTLSLPNILLPLTPLTGMDDANPLPTVRKRRKSVNFSSDKFKSICHFTTTDKPENIRNSKIEVKIDDPESDKKDKEFSDLRNYENAWSPVPRNVIHIQKFKSSKARHVQYELPVNIQSFKLVRSNSEETEDKLTCLKVTLNVQNLNYEKKVVIRYTVDKWKSFKEVEAKYVKCIREATKDEGDGIKGVVGLDRFVARIQVGDYFVLEEKPGHICNLRPTKMLLVARYEVNNNTYWDNNDFTDYHIELVRINAGYDVPRVSKHGKPIPCPGCCMDGKQSNSIDSTGKKIKNNRRTVRKIGGVFGNFTEAVGKNNDHTNFMADKEKTNLYMGMDGIGNKDSSISESKNCNSAVKEVKVLTKEPQSIEDVETSPKKKTIPKKKMNSFEKMMRPDSYGFGCSPSMSGSPMFSMLNSYPISTTCANSSITTTAPANSTVASTNTTTTNTTGPISTKSSSIYSTSSLYGGNTTTPSKYDPPVSTTSSLYQNSMTGMGMSFSSYGSNSSYSSYDVSSHSKYELSPYNGGISYDPSAYSSTSSSLSYATSSSKYNPPNEGYSENKFSKYDPPNYYNKSFSSPLPSVTSTSNLTSTPSPYEPSLYGSAYSSSSMYDPYDSTSHINTQYGNFSEYNFGNNLKEKAQNNKTQDYSLYSGGRRSSSKYDIPFSTYSSFGDNFSSYYSISPSAVTY